MTLEEKAKAYDEALERAKEIKSRILSSHLSTESCKAVSEYIDEIIPELCESEDERIRKHLVAIVELYWGKTNDPDKAKELAWLEKRKECVAGSSKTSADEDERMLNKIISYLEMIKMGCVICTIDTSEEIAYLEKQKEPENVSASTMIPSCWAEEPSLQKEQKPAEWSEEDVLNRTYEEGFNDGLKYRKPVKRSDEDKKMSDWLIGLVNANTELSFKDKVNLTRWLEHLTIEKELSKNDKRIIDAIMIGYQDKDFRSSQIPTPIGVSKDEVIAWLKSLRPQPKVEWTEEEAKKAAEDYADEFQGMTHENDGSTIEDYDKPYNDFLAGVLWAKHHGIFQNGNTHWKPSEEQMGFLWSIYQGGEEQEPLRELIEQLKKLL